jgi:hypothetical protein
MAKSQPEVRELLTVAAPQAAGDTTQGSVLRARLHDGPLKGATVEVAFVEARPPKTIEVPDEQGSTTYRYCLSQWTQKGEVARYTFLYAV